MGSFVDDVAAVEFVHAEEDDEVGSAYDAVAVEVKHAQVVGEGREFAWWSNWEVETLKRQRFFRGLLMTKFVMCVWHRPTLDGFPATKSVSKSL